MIQLRTLLRSAALLLAATLGVACNSGNRASGEPTLASVQPATGATLGGTTVTLTGSNFTADADVTFGGGAAATVTVVDDTTITATTPYGLAGAVDVRVVTNRGAATLADGFTYQTAPPALTGVSPQSGLEIGGTPITLTGANFFTGATVAVDGTPCTNVVVLSANVLTATAPAGAVGAVAVTVTTSEGTVTVGNAFTYLDADPSLQGITPTTGSETGGTLVTVTGENFLGAVTVTFGGVVATSVTVVDTGTLTAVTPVGVPGDADVVVTTAQGSDTLADGFAFAPASLFVTNNQSSSWSVHGLADNGDTPPARVVSGGNTGLNHPIGVCVADGKVYVANIDGDSILVYDASASGDAAPVQEIVGAATQMDGPTGVCVDATRGEIYVVNVFANRVTVYDVASNGNAAPLRVLQGANTGLGYPEGVWTVDGELFVANGVAGGNGLGSVTVYGLTDAGNVGPRRTLAGVATGLTTPQGIYVANGHMFVANRDGNSITVYPTTANGDVAPTREIVGVNTGLDQPQSVFATATEIYVANAGNNTVTVYPLAATGDATPTRTLGGASTGFNGLEGVVVR